jgi:hypothetical protein
MTIMSNISKIPTPIKWGLGIGIIFVLSLLMWFGVLTKAWNGIGNWLFSRQINAERAKVQKELDQAAEQKKVLEQTLLEYKQAKEELVTVKAEKDRLEQVFNDKSKTASDKVAEFKAAAADTPVHTPTDNITTADLCARAKAAGSSPGVVAALCGQ